MTDLIIKARTQMLIEEPFWGTLAMHLRVVSTSLCTTMATDGKTLWYNPEYPARPGMTLKRVKFSWKHEVLHCSLGHVTRRCGRDPTLWNIACDHVVNIILKKAGEEIPPNLFCDMRFDGFSAEQIYRTLQEETKQDQDDQDQEQQEEQDQDGAAKGDESGDETDGAGGGAQDGQEGEDGAEPSNGDGGASDDESGNRPGGASGDAQSGATGAPGQGAGGPSNGNAPGEPVFNGDPGDCGEIIDAAPAHDKADLDQTDQEWKVFTQQAVNVARRGEGRVPGYAELILDRVNQQTTDWRDALRRFIDPVSTTRDFTWSSPNRRMHSLGYMVPGTVSDGIQKAAFIIDSSASVDDALLAIFAEQAQTALDNGAIDKVVVVICDTEVKRTGEYVKGDIIDFSLPGRGGTRFAPAFTWLSANHPDIACAVYLTDLDCTDYGLEPDFPIMWAAYGDPLLLKQIYIPRVPFGEVIDVQS